MPKSGRVGKRQGSHSSFLILPFTKKETQVVMVKYVLVHCCLALGSQLDKPKFSDNGAMEIRDLKGTERKEEKKKIPEKKISQQDEPVMGT